MKLGIIDHKEFYVNKEEYRTSDGYNKIVETLATYFDKVVLYVPVVKKIGCFYEKLNTKNIEICALPGYKSNLELLLKFPLIFKILILNAKKCDIFQIRIPSHIGILGFFIAKLFNKSIFIYLAGDWAKVIRCRFNQGVKKYICPFYVSFAEVVIRFIIKRALTFVTGEYLYNKYRCYPNVYLYISSSLFSKDIIQKDDTCQRENIKILFVGRLVPEKGIKYLLEAIKLLYNRNIKVKLDIVGEGVLKEELKKEVENLNIKERVNFLGYLTHNEDFFWIFDQADIFVLPSLGGEGSPKVILEAMARSIPVIATNDGGIPWLIKDKINGIIIKKASSEAICQAIEKIIKDKNTRKKIILNAHYFIKELTLASQTDKMLKIVFKYKNANRI